ncbi:MAG TPA: porin family protein [Longimicrobium sp.]|jgi:hypothetical protein
MRGIWSTAVAAALVLGAASGAAAQGISVGVKAGVNVATLGGDDVEDADSRIGLVGGAFLVYRFSDMLAIQPEVLYSQKGASFSDTEGELTVKLDYVDVPVLLRLNVPVTGSSLRPSVFAGPVFSLRASCGAEAEFNGGSVEVDCDELDEEGIAVKDTDVGLAFGAGLDFPAGRATVTLDGRYTLGLSSIDDSDLDADVKNRAFAVMLGIAIPLMGR